MSGPKLTVLHSVSSWLPLTETWLFNQVRFLPPHIENHIVSEETENLDQFYLPNIHSLRDATRWRYLWDKGLRKIRVRHHLGFLVDQAKRHGAQILHSHFGNVGWANLEAARQAGLKHVVTFYGLDVNYLPTKDPCWNDRYRALFSKVDAILCEGPHMARCIVKLGCPEEKVQVHHLGVRVDEIEFKPRVWSPTEPLRVLIAASFREKKGIPYGLEALGRLQNEVPLEITIIGEATREERDQTEKWRILKTIEKHKLAPKIRMLGYQPHKVLMDEAYKHHVFLSPSVTASDGDTEGGAPVTIIEMAATGMPIISTTHCDIPEVIKHGITGLLAEERDVNGLFDHFRWLINQPEAWLEMLQSGRQYVASRYNVSIQGERLGSVYREISEGIEWQC